MAEQLSDEAQRWVYGTEPCRRPPGDYTVVQELVEAGHYEQAYMAAARHDPIEEVLLALMSPPLPDDPWTWVLERLW